MKTTAHTAYEAAQIESQQLLKRLSDALSSHASRAHAYPADWSYVGSLNHYNGCLKACLQTLGPFNSNEDS